MADDQRQLSLHLREAQIQALTADAIAVLSAEGLARRFEGEAPFSLKPLQGSGLELPLRFAALWPAGERSAIEAAIRAAAEGTASSAEGNFEGADGTRRRSLTRFYPIKLAAESAEVEIVALIQDTSKPVIPPATDFLLHRMIEASAEGLGQVDAKGRWRFINSAGAELLGFESPLLAAFARDAHHAVVTLDESCPICESLRTGQPQHGVGLISWHRDGRSLPVSYWVTPIEEGGAIVRFADDSERVSLEQALRQRQAEVSEGERHQTEFIATLAHELRNPLAPMRTALEMLGRTGEGKAPPVTQLREMMDRQVEHLIRLTNEFLELARLASGQMRLKRSLIALRDVLETALEASAPLMRAAETRLTVEMPRGPLMLNADSACLTQAITNVLNNAARFTPAGGAIKVRVEPRGETVMIEVVDTGVGIPPQALDEIFMMFTHVGQDARGLKTGLGIGLHLARRWIELHEGSIVARSAGLGLGSSFTITLPLAKPAASVASTAEPSPTPVVKVPVRVLIVDDNVDAAESLRLLLELGGQHLAVAHDGAEALRRAKEFRPDVVLLDLGLPDMDGFEVARSLRAMPEIGRPTLVAVTGWGGAEDRLKSKEAGFDEHLTKPVEIATIELLLGALPLSTRSDEGDPARNGDTAKAGH